MQLLNSLKLVHYEHPTHRDPRLHLRHNLLAKLDEQVSASQKPRVSIGKNAGELASEAELAHWSRYRQQWGRVNWIS